VFFFDIKLFVMHPQDCAGCLLLSRRFEGMTFSFPHLHLHNHCAFPWAVFSALLITVR
jgi:hypothetical protein